MAQGMPYEMKGVFVFCEKQPMGAVPTKAETVENLLDRAFKLVPHDRDDYQLSHIHVFFTPRSSDPTLSLLSPGALTKTQAKSQLRLPDTDTVTEPMSESSSSKPQTNQDQQGDIFCTPPVKRRKFDDFNYTGSPGS